MALGRQGSRVEKSPATVPPSYPKSPVSAQIAPCFPRNPDIFPGRVPGRLIFITRLVTSAVAAALPPLVRAVTDAGHPVAWVCDPMHANTRRTRSGYKTRDVAAILAEIRGFFAVHRQYGTHPGGIHLELAGEHVTECVGGCVNPVAEDQVPRGYQTACDPRLSPAQALECAAVAAAELSK